MPSAEFFAALRSIIGPERCITDPGLLLAYECDGITHLRTTPSAAVLPESREEVQALVRLCATHGVPITGRGAGTCLSGGATASAGGILVVFTRMKRILKVDAANRLVVVEPGVVNARLSETLRPLGLAYMPDPSSQTACTLGGNVGENSGGPHCIKHGATSASVLALEVVLPDGSVVNCGHARGRTAAPDLRGLIVGSEGTLGLVTAITLHLERIPRHELTLLASYRDMRSACEGVSAVIAAGILPSALEALDDRTIAALEASGKPSGYPRDAAAVLLLEFDGEASAVRAEAEAASALLRNAGAITLEEATDSEQRKRLWKGRKGAFGAMGRLAPDLYVMDTVVPRSKLAEVLPQIGRICDQLGLRLANVFHAGEGNLHPNISYDGRNPDEVKRVIEAGHQIVELCLAAGGVLSGEHGIGTEKRDYMPLMFGADSLSAMRDLREVFDPQTLFNPDKLLPTPRICAESGFPGKPRTRP
ncbi:MAG: FAD-binding protein [Planctomycetes bacterium]|nr:FAD-binding protein [Planctomycetota bacterium]